MASERQQELVRRVIESGHGSTIEHVVFTFAISGVTRTLSHQLVRHRAGLAFDQQSQRYVNYKRPSYMVPGSLTDAPADVRERFVDEMDGSLALYAELLEAGIPGEDARFVMPNATRTNLVMTANLRALIHMSGLRLCTMAQWEIRRLFQLIRHEVFTVSPFLGSFLAPKCVPLGYCDEDRNRDEHCPIRPHKDNVLAAWADKRAAPRRPAGSCPRSEARRWRAPALLASQAAARRAAHQALEARSRRASAAGSTSSCERGSAEAGARVRDQRDAGQPATRPARRDGLHDRRHAHGVRAQRAQHAHLGGGLEGRPEQARVDALLEGTPPPARRVQAGAQLGS